MLPEAEPEDGLTSDGRYFLQTHAGAMLACMTGWFVCAIFAAVAFNWTIRAADVTLKERRRLVLMVRELPLHLGHLRSMASLAEMGAILAPPVPAFYHKPESVDDIVDHSVERVLDLIGLPSADAQRWDGARGATPHTRNK